MEKIYHRHTKLDCSANDLFIVSEGLQCGNCLELVVENAPMKFNDTGSERCPACGVSICYGQCGLPVND